MTGDESLNARAAVGMPPLTLVGTAGLRTAPASLRELVPGFDRTLILAPHPDDESLATGGLIARLNASGSVLRIVFVTSGERNPIPQRYVERRLRINDADRARWAGLRRQEAFCAVKMLGLSAAEVEFLGLPDGRVGRVEGELEAALRDLTARFAPTVIVRPSLSDTHADHRAVARASAPVARAANIAELSYIVHGIRRPPLALALQLNARERGAKRNAISCYRSQLSLSSKRFFSFSSDTELYYPVASERPPRFPLLQRAWEVVSTT